MQDLTPWTLGRARRLGFIGAFGLRAFKAVGLKVGMVPECRFEGVISELKNQ
jgi:hypothetical protein